MSDEAVKSLTWIHVLNYQTKLSQVSSMRNLNTLRNGLNRFRFSEFYTIGSTPVFKNTTVRLFELNNYLKSSLPVYKTEAQAPPLITEYFRIAARRCNPSRVGASALKTRPTPYVNIFTANLSQHLTMTSTGAQEKESSSVSMLNSSRTFDYSYLQQWPASYDYSNATIVSTQKINESTTVDSFVEFVLSFNWYKNLESVNDLNKDLNLNALVAIKDSLSNPKVKSKILPAKKVIEIHDKYSLNLFFLSQFCYQFCFGNTFLRLYFYDVMKNEQKIGAAGKYCRYVA